ncbi:RNA-binding protein 25, partial [Ophiophagus hannah]
MYEMVFSFGKREREKEREWWEGRREEGRREREIRRKEGRKERERDKKERKRDRNRKEQSKRERQREEESHREERFSNNDVEEICLGFQNVSTKHCEHQPEDEAQFKIQE